jgi:hypothetical protein
MVDAMVVDFWSEAWGRPSSGWSHWLIRLSGIVSVVFAFRTRWTLDVRIK